MWSGVKFYHYWMWTKRRAARICGATGGTRSVTDIRIYDKAGGGDDS